MFILLERYGHALFVIGDDSQNHSTNYTQDLMADMWYFCVQSKPIHDTRLIDAVKKAGRELLFSPLLQRIPNETHGSHQIHYAAPPHHLLCRQILLMQ
jgi:hypothetical protein